jgi:hypothetical protein
LKIIAIFLVVIISLEILIELSEVVHLRRHIEWWHLSDLVLWWWAWIIERMTLLIKVLIEWLIKVVIELWWASRRIPYFGIIMTVVVVIIHFTAFCL